MQYFLEFHTLEVKKKKKKKKKLTENAYAQIVLIRRKGIRLRIP